MKTPTKLISAEEWSNKFVENGLMLAPLQDNKPTLAMELVTQIQLNALEWAAEQIGNDAIFQQRPADFGLLLQRKQLILSKIAELKKGTA